MGRATQLWTASADLARACEDHEFVQGIASGELPRARFLFYVEQDAWFLTAFARAYALSVAKATDLDTMLSLRTLLDGTFDELRLHRGYARRWGADLEPAPAEATLAYTDFLLRVAWSEPTAHILAAMAPCMRLYAHLGRTLAPITADDSPYREWVETYGDPEFEALARQVENLLDSDDGDEQVMAGHYRNAMLLERRFFDQALA
jgi:thiaminase (transcriptional activator TenA)